MSDYVLKDFKIAASVMKAYEDFDIYDERPARRYIIGKASGTQVDREGERMAKSAIEAFQRAISQGIYTHNGDWSLVPLVSTHKTNGVGESEWDKVIGYITKAWIDESNDLWIEAELDEDNPTADMLYRKLTRPTERGRPVQLGFSVGGRILKAGSVWDHELGKSVYEYQDVALRHVMVTSAPAYPTEYLSALAKSVNWNKVSEAEEPHQEESMTEMTENVIEKSEESTEAQVEEVVKSEETEAQEETVEKEEAVTEETVEETVEKAEESDAEQVEYVAKSEFDAIRERIEILTKSMAEFAATLEKLATPAQIDEAVTEVAEKSATAEEQIEEVAKAEEVQEPAAEVTKSEASVDVETAVSSAVEKSMASVLEKFTELIKPLADRIEAVENEEVDKSISVTRASEVTKGLLDGGDTEFEEKLKNARGADAIAAAIF